MGWKIQLKRQSSLQDLWVWAENGTQKVGTFSSGMKRKLALAKSIINDPQILFLDEPTAGLDPETQKMVRELIMDLVGNNE
ncbi:MAG: ATP-binding cassette domain-containing protein [Actinomycetota bacterium]|nr:ATP-binding cassette domain-containing protein [Actinomycetota bacterium]